METTEVVWRYVVIACVCLSQCFDVRLQVGKSKLQQQLAAAVLTFNNALEVRYSLPCVDKILLCIDLASRRAESKRRTFFSAHGVAAVRAGGTHVEVTGRTSTLLATWRLTTRLRAHSEPLRKWLLSIVTALTSGTQPSPARLLCAATN